MGATTITGTTVAVGFVATADPAQLGPPVTTATTDDGATWSSLVRLPVPDGFDLIDQISAIATVGGHVMVTGSSVGPGAVSVPTVWTSDDGSVGSVATDGHTILVLGQQGYGPVTTLGLISSSG